MSRTGLADIILGITADQAKRLLQPRGDFRQAGKATVQLDSVTASTPDGGSGGTRTGTRTRTGGRGRGTRTGGRKEY